jgi:hypothetical protein
MFKPLRLVKNEQAHHYYMDGDKKKQLEPPEVHLHFPCGQVSVTRCQDGTYWVHVSLEDFNEDGFTGKVGKLIDARIDCKDKSVNECDTGDLKDPELYHLAIKMERSK